jgi:hypothetical protein
MRPNFYIVLFFVLGFFLPLHGLIAQSKKEQIESLIFQKDSLIKIVEREQEQSRAFKIDQEKLISSINNAVKEFEKQLIQSKGMIEEMNNKLTALEQKIKIYSDSTLFFKSELQNYQALELTNLLGEWCEEDKSIGGSISIGGNIFEGYSASYSTNGPFQEAYRIEKVNKSKMILYLESVEGTFSFAESVGQEYFVYVDKCKNEKFAEVDIISDNELRVNTNFTCRFLPDGWRNGLSYLSDGIYSKKKSENIFCVD